MKGVVANQNAAMPFEGCSETGAAAMGGQYAGYKLAMKESGMTVSDFGAAAEVAAATETAQGYEYARRVGGGTGAAHIGAAKGAMQGAQDNAYYGSMSAETGAHIGDVKGGEQLGYDLGRYGNLDRGTAVSANYKRGVKAAGHDRAYNEHATVDAAAGSGRAAGEIEAGVDTGMSETYGREGSAFETAYKGTLDNEIKKREHYEELIASEIETASTAAGTLSGKTASKVAKRLKGWRKSGTLDRMIEEQSGANAAVETSAYSAATEAADNLLRSNKFQGMSREDVLSDLKEALHFGAASQLAGQVAGAKGMQKIFGGSIADAMMTTAAENSFWRGAHDAVDAMALESVSGDDVGTMSFQDSSTRGMLARLGEFANHSNNEAAANENVEKAKAKVDEAEKALAEAKKEPEKGTVAEAQKRLAAAKEGRDRALEKLRGAKSEPEREAARQDYERYNREVEDIEGEIHDIQRDAAREFAEAYSKKPATAEEARQREEEMAAARERLKPLQLRENELKAAETNLAKAKAELAAAQSYKQKVEGRYSPMKHGAARYKQTAETAAAGGVAMEKGVDGFEHNADFRTRFQHMLGMEAMSYNARGVGNDRLAETAATLSMATAGNFSIAAARMNDKGFLAKMWQDGDAGTREQLMAHGFGIDDIHALSALQGQRMYGVQTMVDGEDAYFSMDSDGGFRSHHFSSREGYNHRVDMNYDNVTEMYSEAMGSDVASQRSAAQKASWAGTAANTAAAILPGGRIFRAFNGAGKALKGLENVNNRVLTRAVTRAKAAKITSWSATPPSNMPPSVFTSKGAKNWGGGGTPQAPNGQVQPGVVINTISNSGGGSY